MPAPRSRACAGLAAAVTVAGLLAASSPAVAARAAATSSASAAPATTRGLTPAQALARAKAGRHPVVATSLTSAESQTTANPNGTLTLSQSRLPARALRGGQWHNFDATLQRTGNSITPALTASPVTLSAGGSGPLAVMMALGRTLSLYWPTTLPAPTISGPTATYSNVLPGVDLAVTADTLGGISDTLIIKTPAAASDAGLAAVSLRAVASPGLKLAVDAAGDLAVTAGSNAEPAFTAQAPLMWDSAPPPAGLPTVTNAAGVRVNAQSGLPASSSPSGPGAGADVSQVPVTVSGSTITLSPPAAALNRPAADFPIYIDPSYHSAVGGKSGNWTQADSGFPTTSYWKESSDLQTGLCDFSGCNGMGVARSFFTLPISSTLDGAIITGSNAYVNDVWSASCTAEPVQLWTTGAITSSTNWNTQNASGYWKTQIQSQSYAYGHSGCDPGGKVVGYDITSVVQADVAGHVSTQTFGLKVGNEGNDLQWKQFGSGASNLTISTSYYFKPNQPTNPTANGACGTSASPNVIGNDDVTFTATASDKDGDPSLTTTYTIWNSSGISKGTYAVTKGENQPAPYTLSKTTILGWNPSGGVYHWSAVTTDENNAAGPVSATCYFKWDPAAPASPGVTVSPASQTIGQQVTITITPPAGCSPTTNACPTSYTYQLGPAAPVTVTVGSGSCTSTSCPVTATISQLGSITITVTGIANGNPGQSNSGQVVTGNPPAAAYADGHFTGGTYPDLLTLGTSTTDPSLWLSAGTGNGTLGPAVDIGSLGTGINPGTDGPADWAGAQISHGNLAGNSVQDVLAYYPAGSHAGNAVIIRGSGDATLDSASANTAGISSDKWYDPVFSNTAYIPASVVAAGNASQSSSTNRLDDLIAIYGGTPGYELGLYTATGTGNYFPASQLSTTAPDGTADWNNYTLATAQPGGNPDAVVLLALDKATGALYESVNPNCNTTVTTGCEKGLSNTLVGMPGSTWTTLTVPWGTSAPDMVSADISNNNGLIELWTMSGTTAMPYSISGSTVTSEGSPSALTEPSDEWPLTDGGGTCNATTPPNAIDTITGTKANIAGTGTYNWACDNTFTTDLSLSASGGGNYVVPPAGTVLLTNTTFTLSLWFKTSAAGGVLASLQKQAVSNGGTATGYYDPVLYIGTDGKLWGQWYDSPQQPVESTSPVDDGLWHHAVLTATTSGSTVTQTLSIDGAAQGGVTGSFHFTSSWTGSPTNLTYGTGYIGGNWPDEPNNGSSGKLLYYTGTLANITLTHN